MRWSVRDCSRDVLRLSYAISAILPQNTRSRRVAPDVVEAYKKQRSTSHRGAA